MALQIGVSIPDAAKFAKNLERFARKNIYVAMSKAEQRAGKLAQAKAKKSMVKDLHNPARSTVNAVRMEFRQAGKIKAGLGGAKVFVAPFLVDELWPNTITHSGNPRKLETRVPKKGRGVLNPSKRLLNQRTGNIKGLRNNKLKRLRDSKKYFEVSIGSKIKAKNGGFLKPGIYEIRQLRRTRRIRLVLEYKTQRKIVPKWRFREVVRRCYDNDYPIELNKAINEELDKLF